MKRDNYKGSGVRAFWDTCEDPFNLREGKRGARAVQAAFDWYVDPATAYVLKFLPEGADRLLEVGCGNGAGLSRLAGVCGKLYGIDMAGRRCRAARACAPSAVVICGDATALPFADGMFDVVYVRDLLMYGGVDRIIEESKRVLVPGGRLLLVESLRGAPWICLYRRIFYPPAHTAICRHLSFPEFSSLSPQGMRQLAARPFYLAGAFAFVFLVTGHTCLYRAVLALTGWVDNLLLRITILKKTAWRGVVVLEKKQTDDNG